MNPNRPINEVMTSKLVTVGPTASAYQIKAIFDQNEFHHLPVVETNDKLLGIISKQDFYKVAYILSLQTTGRTWSEKEYEALCAKDLMTEHPLTLEPEDTIGLAADIFLANQFHAIPVVEDDRLIGLVTTHDLLFYSFNSPIVEEWQ
ncbi:MAG: CBS domain-containing protein [Haliscomenobacter sp.]|uniref:CBS domain-containing protein n=1 Tax=Haliscomenobacter sp. TaxID=2717303 RepID=UPI0029BEB285|nr:CBS domain-containing protein [Haliscomenobacter sp.]MDX2069572.1 CBS domain-containing protein [Haliscomenobacter sp.]